MTGVGWVRARANWGSCGTPEATLKATGASGAEGWWESLLMIIFLKM